MKEFKIVVLGSENSGKGTLIMMFDPGIYDPTIEDSYRKQIDISGVPCVLEILDTTGTEDYTAMRDICIHIGEGFIMLFSIDSAASFFEIDTIREQVYKVKDTDNVPMILVGNKRNDEKREVAIRDAEDYATKHNMLYIEVCPKTNEGVTAAFHLLVMELLLKDTTRARPREKWWYQLFSRTPPQYNYELSRMEIKKQMRKLMKQQGVRFSDKVQITTGHILSEQELLVLDHVLSAHSNKKVTDIRRVVQQSQDGELTLEEIISSLREAGLAAIAKGLKEKFEKDVENVKNYEAYQHALQGEEKLKLLYLKFMYFGLPRSGKSSTFRRLIQEIVNLKQVGGVSKSTGIAESREVIIKKVTSAPAAIVKTDQEGETSIWQSLNKSKKSKKKKGKSKQGVCNVDHRYLAQVFYQLISRSTIASDTKCSEESKVHGRKSPSVSYVPQIQGAIPPVMSNHEVAETPQPDEGNKDNKLATTLEEGAKDDQIELAFEQLNSIIRSDSPEEFCLLLENLILLNMIDVGGQPAFVEMLPALTVGSALYLLFFRMDQELRELYPVRFLASEKDKDIILESSYCIEDVLCQSLSSVACFSSFMSNQQSVSRALLFGTHKDLVEMKGSLEARISAINSTLWEKLSRIQPELLLKADKDNNFFLVDNMNGDDEIDHIRKEIETIIHQVFPPVDVPPSWLIFRILLYFLDKPVVSLHQCQEIARRIKMPTSVESAVWFFHHHIGSLMHYPEVQSMKDAVICDTQVIFDSVSELIIDTFSVSNRAIPQSAIRDFQDKGHFTLEHIECSTKSHRSCYLSPKQLIDLLKYLNILAEIKPEQEPSSPQRLNFDDLNIQWETLPQSELRDLGSISYKSSSDFRESNHEKSSSQVYQKYIIPAVLKCASEDELKLQARGSPNDQAYPLKIHFDCGFVPYGVFCGGVAYLIAQQDTLLPTWQLSREFKVNKNKVVFLVDGTFDTVLISRPLNLEIQVYRCTVARKKKSITEICSSICQTVIEVLETVIFKLKYKAAIQTSEKRPFHLAFPCTCEGEEDSNHLMKVIEDEEEIYGKCIRKDIELRLEEKHMVWFNNSIDETNVHANGSRERILKAARPENVSVSEEHVHASRERILTPVEHSEHSAVSVILNTDHLSHIQNVLWSGRKKWRNIGLQLGMSVDDLDVIQHDNPYHTGDCFTKMLSIWLQKKKQTLGSLISALRSPPVGLGQLAEELAHTDLS